MLVWEDKTRFTDTSWLAAEIERMGLAIIEKYNIPKMLHEREDGRYWFKHFKVWEYPFSWQWLQRVAARLGKKTLKVMDFGCWISPFPQFLACQGHEVWGVDNDAWGHIKVEDLRFHYPKVYYFINDVLKMTDFSGFDAIISCSVLEHIPVEPRIEILNHLRRLLQPKGKMMHIVDFYFPEKPGKEERKRMNFWEVANRMGFPVPEPAMCPGSPDFDFERIRGEKSVKFLREWNQEARIAIGDDV